MMRQLSLSKPASEPAEAPDAEPTRHGLSPVRLGTMLWIGFLVTTTSLLVNVSFSLATDSTTTTRWLAAPVLGLMASAMSAISQARAPADVPAPSNLDLLPKPKRRLTPRALGHRFGSMLGSASLAVALVIAIVVVGGGGFVAATAGHYAMGWVTGNETGKDRLAKPTTLTVEDFTITVSKVVQTTHFTRVSVEVTNNTPSSIAMPIGEGNCLLIGGEGTTRRADAFRSDWDESIPVGGTKSGVITFSGRLPADVVRARLSFVHLYGGEQAGLDELLVTGMVMGPPA